MVTVSAVAVEAAVYIDAVGVRATSTDVCCTFVDIYAIQYRQQINVSDRFWATVCKTVRPMLSVRCLSVLSVCNVRVLWPNGWTDQDETWHAGRPRPWPHCVRWGPSYPSPKGAHPPIFGPYRLRPNGCMDQDVTWYGGRPRPRRHCVRWGPSPLPQLSAHFYCGQTAACIKMSLGIELGLVPGDFVLDGTQLPLPQRGTDPQFSAHIRSGQMAAWIKMSLIM